LKVAKEQVRAYWHWCSAIGRLRSSQACQQALKRLHRLHAGYARKYSTRDVFWKPRLQLR